MRWLLKRWWVWGGAGFILVMLSAGYLLIPVEERKISQASCDKIQVGMTKTQVDWILGETHVGWIYAFGHGAKGFFWSDDDGNEIRVQFSERFGVMNGVVEGKEFRPTELSFIELMKRRIERRIRALWP